MGGVSFNAFGHQVRLDEDGQLREVGPSKPPKIRCEAPRCMSSQATHIYGPECEALTGQLMYLCSAHADAIRLWMVAHANDPVECATHGRIGPVKSYLILREM